MPDDKRLTLSKINLMAFAAGEQRGGEEDAKKLLELFCECVERGQISARNTLGDRLLEHVRESLRAFLNGERDGTIDGAVAVDVFPNGERNPVIVERQEKSGIPRVKVPGIEAAFGLVHKKGRPQADEQRRMKMAESVLRRHVGGTDHQTAVDEVGEEFGCAASVVSEAWRQHREIAPTLVSVSRGHSAWTDEELPRLRMALRRR